MHIQTGLYASGDEEDSDPLLPRHISCFYYTSTRVLCTIPIDSYALQNETSNCGSLYSSLLILVLHLFGRTAMKKNVRPAPTVDGSDDGGDDQPQAKKPRKSNLKVTTTKVKRTVLEEEVFSSRFHSWPISDFMIFSTHCP
jgi:hypothetical protein